MSVVIAENETGLVKWGERELTVEFPGSSVAYAEERLGNTEKSLYDIRSWFGLKNSELMVVFYAGLRKHHPEISEEEIVNADLGVEAQNVLRWGLIRLNWKRTLEELEASRPNARSGDAR